MKRIIRIITDKISANQFNQRHQRSNNKIK